MSEFSGKKFYGYSMQNDPSLLASRNFEFRYTRPEQLDRAHNKAHDADGTKVKKTTITGNKLKKQEKDISPDLYSNDLSQKNQRGRPLSENEINQLIVRAKKVDEPKEANEFVKRDKSVKKIQNIFDCIYEGCEGSPRDINPDLMGNNKQQCSKNSISEYYQYKGEASNKILKKFFTKIALQDIRTPKPQFVEIIEQGPSEYLVVSDVIEPAQSDKKFSKSEVRVSATRTIIQDDLDEESPHKYSSPFEDPDLEYEMQRHDYYSKYCQPRPIFQEVSSASVASGGCAQFIEVEPIGSGRCFKNTAPMLFTEMTDDTVDDAKIRVVIKKKGDKQMLNEKYIKSEKNVHMVEPIPKEKHICTNTIKSGNKTVKHKIVKRVPSPTMQAQPNVPSSAKMSRSPAMPPLKNINIKPSNTPRSTRTRSSKVSKNQSEANQNSMPTRPSRPRRSKNVVLTQSLEELKLQKMDIFNKMSQTQGRIIDLLDKLRLTLVEHHNIERPKTKSSFEFSVRFSRNFIYPLKGMAEDVKQTPATQFYSASTNEPCSRIFTIYQLVVQALNTYFKQIQYFISDPVPQKLITLLEITYAVSKICLEKGVFDPEDAIVECLMDRCSKFVIFLQDVNGDRFLPRTLIRKSQFDKGNHNRYDLKMFMNDLNMYEPKLVPKQRSKGRRKTGSSALKEAKRQSPALSQGSSEMALAYRKNDEVVTQIQGFASSFTSGLLKESDTIRKYDRNASEDHNRSQNDPKAINQVILDALQIVTKEQVRQVLEPIMHTLGNAFEKQQSNGIGINLKQFKRLLKAEREKWDI